MSDASQGETGHSSVTVVVPVYNGGDDLRRCLEAVRASRWPVSECIVVDDASTDGAAATEARRHGARLLTQPGQRGPAAARNAGAAAAQGDLLLFVDADVLLHPDAVGRAVEALDADPTLAAVFGSYDEQPSDPTMLSRYRNLYHHWNHQVGNAEASTFWTGCGAVRRSHFLALGGFSEDFERPSIEDIEFGYRLRAGGHRIRLLRDMQCTHLKRWTLRNMVYTDLFLRGVPWVALLQRFPDAPADLNLGWRARLATLCTGLLLLSLFALLAWRPLAVVPFAGFLAGCLLSALLTAWSAPGRRVTSAVALALAAGLPLAGAWAWPDPWAVVPLALVSVVVATQPGFYRLLARLHGVAFALAAVPLQLVFFFNCGLAVPLGLGQHLRHRLLARRQTA